MNTYAFVAAILYGALAGGRLAAQDGAPPRHATNPIEPPAKLQSAMETWIATTDAQWQTAFKRDVAAVHEREFNNVKLQFLNALEDALKKATASGDLDGALALRNEQQRFAENNVLPERDEADVPALLKAIRAATRATVAKLDRDHSTRAKALLAKYDQALAQAQALLTQNGRLDDAVLVKAKRTEVAGLWLPVPTEKKAAAGPPAVARQSEPPAVFPQPGPPTAATAKPGDNMIVNGNFGEGTKGWAMSVTSASRTGKGMMRVDLVERRNGNPTLRIEHLEGDDTWVQQTVAVKPHRRYELSGYIKTQDVKSVKPENEIGATFCMGMGFMPKAVAGTKEWTKISVKFDTSGRDKAFVGPAMGCYNGHVTGTAWFSDMCLTELPPSP